MSDSDHKPFDHDDPLKAVVGVLASGATGELSRPLLHLRENLAVMIETIEKHISHSGGPMPYPWHALQALRQELADSYLLARETTHIVSELSDAVGPGSAVPTAVDINRQVETALHLVRSRFRDDTEIFVDLGSLPPVRAIAGEFLLAIAKLLLCCADSAAAAEGSAVSVKTRCEHEDELDTIAIYIVDNGRGHPDAAASARRVVEPVMQRVGGSFAGVSEPEQGSAYECRIPIRSR